MLSLLENRNVGCTGPADKSNPQIMTQSFVHRTHLDIFGVDSYFPRAFKNWWSDDWISAVYAPNYAVIHQNIHLINTNIQNTRYQVHRASQRIVMKEIMLGKEIFQSWLQKFIQN